ncbi:hypothetical protein [Dokdonia donghaensis]|uniref:hypothetical protein n=1 Tax=Dokdonia donghaensis TaxID=326320 RepID=UPI0035C7A08D
MIKEDVVISQGSRSLLENIIAATCYTATLFCLYQSFVDLKHVGGYAYFGTTCFIFGLRYSISKYYRFNFKNHRFRDMSTIGSIEWGNWVQYEELSYVAVFLNSKDFYEINLWYDERRHFNLSNYQDLDDALDVARAIALQLELDVYDAGTDPYDTKWL